MIEAQGMTRAAHGDMRRGKLSGSMAKDLMSGSFRTWNRMLKALREPHPFFGVGPNTPAPLRWGKEHEDRALAIWWDKHPALDLMNPVCVAYRGEDPVWQRNVVTSPDRVIYDPLKGSVTHGLEAKCPYNPNTMPKWVMSGGCPPEHYDQCAFGSLVTGIPWVFVAYDPRMAEENELFEVEVLVPQSYLDEMFEKGTRFLLMLEGGGEFQPTSRQAAKLKEMFSQ